TSNLDLETSIPTNETIELALEPSMECSLSCGCELVAARGPERLWRLFGLDPRSRRGSRSAAALDAPGPNRSLAGDFFPGCCAAAPERSSNSKLFLDTFSNIQGRRDRGV